MHGRSAIRDSSLVLGSSQSCYRKRGGKLLDSGSALVLPCCIRFALVLGLLLLLGSLFFFLNSKYFFLLSMWLSLPEVEHFDYEVWQRENVYHMYFTTKIMVPLFELIQPHSPQDSSLRESGLPSKSCLAPLPVTSFSSMAFIQSKTANRLFFFLIYCMAI